MQRPLRHASLFTRSWRCSHNASASNRGPRQWGMRFITNASKHDYVPSLLDVRRVNAKPGGWHPTLVHSSGELKFTVIRLQPGRGEVPSHLHTHSWDYFMPLSGEAVIETKSKDGVQKDYNMTPGSFLAIPPEDVHRVRNASDSDEFVFFIVQAPRQKYDFVAA